MEALGFEMHLVEVKLTQGCRASHANLLTEQIQTHESVHVEDSQVTGLLHCSGSF